MTPGALALDAGTESEEIIGNDSPVVHDLLADADQRLWQ